jgi:hypothetical protein
MSKVKEFFGYARAGVFTFSVVMLGIGSILSAVILCFYLIGWMPFDYFRILLGVTGLSFIICLVTED